MVSSCITIPFGKLFTSARYVDEPLLTLTPLYSDCSFLVRLACLNPAASVRSEPGSNSSKEDLSGSHMIESRRIRSVSARSEDRVVLDGSICMDPEISPERLIPFFSSPRLLRCQRHRFYPAFSALSAGFSNPPAHVREAQYVRHTLSVKHEFFTFAALSHISLRDKRLHEGRSAAPGAVFTRPW